MRECFINYGIFHILFLCLEESNMSRKGEFSLPLTEKNPDFFENLIKRFLSLFLSRCMLALRVVIDPSKHRYHDLQGGVPLNRNNPGGMTIYIRICSVGIFYEIKNFSLIKKNINNIQILVCFIKSWATSWQPSNVRIKTGPCSRLDHQKFSVGLS